MQVKFCKNFVTDGTMVRNKFGINGKKNTELDNLFKYLFKNNY
jgi:hypothetical protein